MARPAVLGQYLSGIVNGWASGAYSQEHVDIFSFSANQAALAAIRQPGLAVGADKRYQLKELDTYRAVIVLPLSPGTFGLQAISRGFSDYRESRVGLACGKRLGSKASIGIQANYSSLRIAGYGKETAITAELGFLLHLTSRLHTGIQLDNPIGKRPGVASLQLPSIYTIGWGYDLSGKLFFSVEMVKEQFQPLDTKWRIQYVVTPAVLIRVMLQSAGDAFWFGAGFSRDQWRLDLYTSYHLRLGSSAGLLLHCLLKKKARTE